MADREVSHSQRPIHYAKIIPSSASAISNAVHESSGNRKRTELERAKALYVDFDDAFQNETTNHDYFGSQSNQSNYADSEHLQRSNDQPANFYLQSIETVSEVKNTNFSPFVCQEISHEGSSPSVMSDIPPNLSRHNHCDNQFVLPCQHHDTSDSNGTSSLSDDFAGLEVVNSNDTDESIEPFPPDTIKIKIKHTDVLPLGPSEFKLLLPQYFLVKYLGRTKSEQLWGTVAVRGPIDEMVHNARQLSSVNEIPTLEACVNSSGLTLAHRQSLSSSKRHSQNHGPESQQNGLIPLEYISYVMHDTKYSKISACIVVRPPKGSFSNKKTRNITVTECYAFLFQSKEHAHRFALSLAEAFNGQKCGSKGRKQNLNGTRSENSSNHRSKQRNSHHHERLRGRYDDSYLRDSEV